MPHSFFLDFFFFFWGGFLFSDLFMDRIKKERERKRTMRIAKRRGLWGEGLSYQKW